ncbi:hypothetical protein CMI37_22330 [Candidatus Pacearchaeota archaeon]|nr:hypothetical protein [Candidatus Pacearchaeota archaeon]|tara:strand:- start:3883 stop:4380 length:498 start_codon:yes stop_codon:yes gene_type:complete
MAFKSDKQRKAFFAKQGTTRSDVIPRINPLKLKSNRLPIQFSVLVPSTKLDKKISTSSFRKRIDDEKKFMSKTFGGDTSVKSTGSFVLKRGKKDILIKEKNVIVESSTTTNKFNENRSRLIRHLKAKQKQWKQNSVLYKLEGESFIFPRQSFIPHDRSRRRVTVT